MRRRVLQPRMFERRSGSRTGFACARCDFYTPKASGKGRLLEAKDNLQRMPASVPLSDEERAAVDDGRAALDQLPERLVDVPTPAGMTPRHIGAPATAMLLPIVAVNQGGPAECRSAMRAPR
ncbi:hypothetical protein ACWGR4_33575 [Embleya sp. NPDC055664]